jgi:hypothetical protein
VRVVWVVVVVVQRVAAAAMVVVVVREGPEGAAAVQVEWGTAPKQSLTPKEVQAAAAAVEVGAVGETFTRATG